MRPPEHYEAACRGPGRRAFLHAGLTSVIGLGLTDLLRLRAIADGAGGALPNQVKNCILVWLAGGASHLDTFDPKPDAEIGVRGEFRPIATSVPGLSLSEVLPNLARVMNRVTLIRSITSPEADHARASHHLLTGYRPNPSLVYPCHGSVVAKAVADRKGSLPSHVAIPDAPLFAGSGFLSTSLDPFSVGSDPNATDFRVRDLSPPDRLTLDRLRRRRAMVRTLDEFSRDIGETPLTAARDRFGDRAYDLLTSSAAQAAFRIGDEPREVRERYGRNPFGQSCLLARRLVEAGVSFVTVNDRGPGALGWDTHAQNFPQIRDTLAPPLDRGLAALIGDLGERGLLGETLVVMVGEFGRTPKINNNAGRDHHGRANSALLAGGGMPGGLVVGRTDARGDSPTDRPITPADLAASIYTAIGINPNHQIETADGRPIRLVEGGTALRELVGVTT